MPPPPSINYVGGNATALIPSRILHGWNGVLYTLLSINFEAGRNGNVRTVQMPTWKKTVRPVTNPDGRLGPPQTLDTKNLFATCNELKRCNGAHEGLDRIPGS